MSQMDYGMSDFEDDASAFQVDSITTGDPIALASKRIGQTGILQNAVRGVSMVCRDLILTGTTRRLPCRVTRTS